MTKQCNTCQRVLPLSYFKPSNPKPRKTARRQTRGERFNGDYRRARQRNGVRHLPNPTILT